jgi:uncharacterized protein (DUF885 family)
LVSPDFSRKDTRVSDDLGTLADDYWGALLHQRPTWRHMLGNYSDVGRYEECSREAEQEVVATLRDFVRRAEDVDAAGLGEQDALTREVVIASATAEADLTETPLTGLAANPVSGLHVQLPLVLGLLSVPDATVAEEMPGKLDAVGVHFHQLAERVRNAADGGWVSPEFAVR